MQRKPKSLWTETTEGELAVRFRADDEHEEALLRRRGDPSARARTRPTATPTSRCSTGRTPRAGCSRTSSCGRACPYRVVGGVRFYQRREIKDVLAYLRLLLNPQDVVSARRVINTPEARHRRRDRGGARGVRRDRAGRLPGGRAGAPTSSPSSATRARGAIAGFVGVMDRLRGVDSGAGRPSGGRGRGDRVRATSSSWRPNAPSRPRAGSRTSASSAGVAAEFEQRSPEGTSPSSSSRSRWSASRTSTTRRPGASR